MANPDAGAGPIHQLPLVSDQIGADRDPQDLNPARRLTPWRRFFGWRWWRGWRGWLIFVLVSALVVAFTWIGLARAFSDPAKPWSEFPGVPQVSTQQILKNESLEQLSARVDQTMKQVREAITDRFGFTWSAKGQDAIAYESNRFHGTSLLNTYDSVNWQTSQTLRTVAEKQEAVQIVSDIMAKNGFGTPEIMNFTGPEAVTEFGGFTLKDQGRWLVSGQPPTVSRGSLNFVILDLQNDRTGMLTQLSDANAAALGWEHEYLSISYSGEFMLKKSDRAEFERRAAIFDGHIQPVPGRNKS